MKTIQDGILDEKRWREAKRKVLFVLKEPGADCGYDSLQDLIQKKWGSQAKFSFTNLGRWAYALQQAPRAVGFEEADIKTNRDSAFISSALINLRKEPSDRPDKSCNEARLAKTAEINDSEIKAQIDSIDPDVIVCCGGTVYPAVQKIMGTTKYKILQICHPSARATKRDKYQALLKAL